MARIRSVKPELCESETMASLPAEVERTFVRLWTHCDDEGRAKDNPKLIKAAIFPLHDDVTAADVDAHLDALVAAGCLVRYEVDGVRCLAVPSWADHQHPQKPRASKFPPPPDTPTDPVSDGSRTSTGPVPDESGPVVSSGEVGVDVSGGDYGDHQVAGPPTTAVPEPGDDAIREAAVLAGRAEASVKADTNPVRYAQLATASILTDPARALDLQRIRRMLGEGLTPTQVGELWLAPFPVHDTPPPPPGAPLAEWDRDRHEAEAVRQRERLDALEATA